VEAVQLV